MIFDFNSNIKSEAVNLPQIKMGPEEMETFLKGIENFSLGLDALSKYDFSDAGATFSYQSAFSKSEQEDEPKSEDDTKQENINGEGSGETPEDNGVDSGNDNNDTPESDNDDSNTPESNQNESDTPEQDNGSDSGGENGNSGSNEEAFFNTLNSLASGEHTQNHDPRVDIYLEAYATGGKSLLGKLIPNFPHYCPVCGKEIGGGEKWGEYLKLIPINGFCSFQCAMKYVLKIVLNQFMPTLNQDQTWLDDIRAVLDFINALVNMLNELPYIISNLARVPDVYKNYLMQKLMWFFTKIKILVNKALIKKNELLIKLLSKIKTGNISKKIQAVIQWINTVIQAINILVEIFEKAYGIAYNIINEILQLFCIPAEGMGFFMTTRSMLVCPGRCMVRINKNINLMLSVIDNINIEGILSLVRVTLPPIQEIEYFLDPDVFAIRYVLSDDNYKMVGKLIEDLMLVLKFGADFLPTWEHLRPWNPFFLVALFGGWCPATQALFAFEIDPVIPAMAAQLNPIQLLP